MLFLRTRALVLELLAAVCLVRGGHDIILSAFDNFEEVRRVEATPTMNLIRGSTAVLLRHVSSTFTFALNFNCAQRRGGVSGAAPTFQPLL